MDAQLVTLTVSSPTLVINPPTMMLMLLKVNHNSLNANCTRIHQLKTLRKTKFNILTLQNTVRIGLVVQLKTSKRNTFLATLVTFQKSRVRIYTVSLSLVKQVFQSITNTLWVLNNHLAKSTELLTWVNTDRTNSDTLRTKFHPQRSKIKMMPQNSTTLSKYKNSKNFYGFKFLFFI